MHIKSLQIQNNISVLLSSMFLELNFVTSDTLINKCIDCRVNILLFFRQNTENRKSRPTHRGAWNVYMYMETPPVSSKSFIDSLR